MQDDVARFVSRALDIELARLEMERVRHLALDTMQPWELYVSALEVWEEGANLANITNSIDRHRRALALDPDYVLSLGQLATLLTNVAEFGDGLRREAIQAEACELADRVARMGQESPFAIFSAVHVLTQMCGQAERAVLIARRIVADFPNSGYNQTQLGNALLHAGHLDEALRVMEDAEQAFADNIYVTRFTSLWKSMVFTEREEWERVIAVSGASLDLNAPNPFDMVYLANALAVLGRAEEATTYFNNLVQNWPGFTVENFEWFLKQGLKTDERVAPYVQGLKLLKES
jgi:tetratricopeptide (TPR) repeat protein